MNLQPLGDCLIVEALEEESTVSGSSCLTPPGRSRIPAISSSVKCGFRLVRTDVLLGPRRSLAGRRRSS
jgi:hypothetical protein